MDEDIDYAWRLIQAGVPTDLHLFTDGPHAFDGMMPETTIARRATGVREDWLKCRLHPATRCIHPGGK
jgi:acetyl esterase/lipase